MHQMLPLFEVGFCSSTSLFQGVYISAFSHLDTLMPEEQTVNFLNRQICSKLAYLGKKDVEYIFIMCFNEGADALA